MLKVESANSLGLIELRPTPLGLIKGGDAKKDFPWVVIWRACFLKFSYVQLCNKLKIVVV